MRKMTLPHDWRSSLDRERLGARPLGIEIDHAMAAHIALGLPRRTDQNKKEEDYRDDGSIMPPVEHRDLLQ
jgi:hypothetical protein